MLGTFPGDVPQSGQVTRVRLRATSGAATASYRAARALDARRQQAARGSVDRAGGQMDCPGGTKAGSDNRGGPPLNDRVAICDAGLAVVSARGLATHRGARRPQTNRGRPSIPGAIGVATVSIAVAAAA